MTESINDHKEYQRIIQASIQVAEKLVLLSSALLDVDLKNAILGRLESDICPILKELKLSEPKSSDLKELEFCVLIVNGISNKWEEYFLWRRNEIDIYLDESFNEMLKCIRELQFNLYILKAWLIYEKDLSFWKDRFLPKKEEQLRTDQSYYFNHLL